MNIAFYVSGKATRLNKLLDKSSTETIQSIKFVFSDDRETIYLKDKLNLLNIPYFLCDYNEIPADKIQKNLILADNLLEILKEYNIDYCFSFGGQILKGELLKVYKNRIINFHPSVLPLFRGRLAIDRAVEDNVKLLGNTAHFIDAGVDTGPIIMQSVVPIKAFYNSGYDAVLDIQIEMFNIIFDLLKKGRVKIIKNKVHIDEADYSAYAIFPKVNMND